MALFSKQETRLVKRHSERNGVQRSGVEESPVDEVEDPSTYEVHSG